MGLEGPLKIIEPKTDEETKEALKSEGTCPSWEVEKTKVRIVVFLLQGHSISLHTKRGEKWEEWGRVLRGVKSKVEINN